MVTKQICWSLLLKVREAMKASDVNLIAVKKKLSEKYTRLALLAGSKVKRASFERKARAYQNQAVVIARGSKAQ